MEVFKTVAITLVLYYLLLYLLRDLNNKLKEQKSINQQSNLNKMEKEEKNTKGAANQPKKKLTAREWFDTLPLSTRNAAMDATSKDELVCSYKSLAGAICNSFVWRESRLGHAYWESIAQKADAGYFDKLPKVELPNDAFVKAPREMMKKHIPASCQVPDIIIDCSGFVGDRYDKDGTYKLEFLQFCRNMSESIRVPFSQQGLMDWEARSKELLEQNTALEDELDNLKANFLIAKKQIEDLLDKFNATSSELKVGI